MNPLIALAVFCMYAVNDGLWTVWMNAATQGHPARAAVSSSVLYVVSAMGVLVYVGSPWYVVPMALGGGAGTYLTTKWEKSRSSNA